MACSPPHSKSWCPCFKKACGVFGGPAEVFKVKKAELLKVKGVKKAALTVLANDPPFSAAEKEIDRAEKMGIKIICFDDDEYPDLLRSIYAPPIILYLRGKYDCLNLHCTAIVGSRAATAYGLKIARQMAAGLTHRGMMVVSGMALGVDTSAHQGALEAGGPTIAVLGCGVDVVYPRQNSRLYRHIINNGLVISEYPLGTPPEGFRFPARNRIISGMAFGVLVVEAAKKSGSLITARMALEEGREVFAIPGRVDSFKSAGTHRLLQEGAKLVHSVDDVLEEIVVTSRQPQPTAPNPATSTKSGRSDISEEEALVLSLLDAYPISVDNLIRKSGLSAAKINELLLLLEIKELIEMQPGQMVNLT
jgi:DNA processing protein